MVARNDITGDKIQTRDGLSEQGEANFEKIFGKKKTNGGWKPPLTPLKTNADWGDEMSEKRQDIIGQNGNIGYEVEE